MYLLTPMTSQGSVNFKFGVLYAKEGQLTDDEMFSNGEFLSDTAIWSWQLNLNPRKLVVCFSASTYILLNGARSWHHFKCAYLSVCTNERKAEQNMLCLFQRRGARALISSSVSWVILWRCRGGLVTAEV